MHLTTNNVDLTVDLKHITNVTLIIVVGVLIFTGKIKEPSTLTMLGSIITIVFNQKK